MPRKAIIFIGHSHLSSVTAALATRAGESYDPDDGAEYFIFDTMRFGQQFQFSIEGSPEHYILNPSLVSAIEGNVPRGYEKVFISMFGGNAHNALSLLEHPIPFDFILPEQPNLPLASDAVLVPYFYMEKMMQRQAACYILDMVCLRNAFPGSMLHVESPPPIGDNRFVLDHLEQYFLSQTSEPKVARKELRYKLWRLHSKIINDAAMACGIEFLQVPESIIDSEGFLASNAYGKDSTHAGPGYGLSVMKIIETKFGTRYGGWNWLY
jgi:hypothetical protein